MNTAVKKTLIIGGIWFGTNLVCVGILIVDRELRERRRFKKVKDALEQRKKILNEIEAVVVAFGKMNEKIERGTYEGDDVEVTLRKMKDDFEFEKIAFLETKRDE